MKLSEKIDISLSEEDLKEIETQKERFFVHRWHREIKPLNLKVGDVLIKYTRELLNPMNPAQGWGPWRPIKVHQRGSYRKFVVVHVDEHGIPYVRSMKVSGTPFGEIYPLADLQPYHRYELDPEYADHILIEGEEEDYDPLKYVRDKHEP